MKRYLLKLELSSPALVGSGEGFGAIIDTDIVFDDTGIPFVPAKRIKGCLLDSAKEVQKMFECSGISKSLIQADKTFGKPGDKKPASVYFSNLFIENYKENREWLKYFSDSEKYNDIVSGERILETFTEIRHQTAISPETGAAKKGSLRAIRVIRKGQIFYGELDIENEDNDILETLYLACLNFRSMGTKRNRGFGQVHCVLLDEHKKEIPAPIKLEAICTD